MRMSEGVEWAVHAAAMLVPLPEGRALPGAKLAEYLGVPPAYLAKHMQALSRAGIVETSRGPTGGYKLARSADKITLYDIAQAIEGKEPAFFCQDIRKRSPLGGTKEMWKRTCGIARSFWAAERAWRESLMGVTLAHVVFDAAKDYDATRSAKFAGWLKENSR